MPVTIIPTTLYTTPLTSIKEVGEVICLIHLNARQWHSLLLRRMSCKAINDSPTTR